MDKQTTLRGLKIGYALTGSFCTFSDSFAVLRELISKGAEIVPIMSENAYHIDTRFGKASAHSALLEELTGKPVIHSILEAEPIGPKKMCDVMVVAPCTGNTLAKLANSITDTAVTMAVKSHIRNARPVVLCVATNDALAGSAKNIGTLMNLKPYYFVPLRQDDSDKKPTSIVADFQLIIPAIQAAKQGVQIQPLLVP